MTNYRQSALDLDHPFGDPPASVQANVEEMSEIAAARARANAAVMAKNDTERYLVIVYPSRAAREGALAAMGFPVDERYLLGAAVTVQLKPGHTLGGAVLAAKAAAPGNSGAAG